MNKFFIPVKGGLGNQMFFYAFKLYLRENGIKAHLVWNEYFFTKQHNGVELFEVFNIQIDKLTKNKIFFLVKINKSLLPDIYKRILGRIAKSKYLLVTKFKQTTPYSFDNVLAFTTKKNIYLDGFWQNYNYLDPVRDKVLKEFNFKLPEKFSENNLLKQIRDCNSVSIHIRRGDYLDPKFANLNVINSNEYYLKAIDHIKEKVESPLFFIFTDDLAWAKNEFISNDFVFIEGNINKDAYLDMYLMSQCKHNIIANSTFSWWGAWLNINPLKTVIAPNFWTVDTLSSLLCPPEWIFLNVN
ncbi:alpha-1,2-fucosyltransferase [Flavobacterium johnsoniae]|uniref:alpha-1,2-fucosyltransferase n=1 Tax=unclassified Flavobacterium TaxID=196869 RepID=UPI000EAEF114